MGAWVDSLKVVQDTLARKNGRWDERTPKVRASDMIAVLGLYSRALPGTIAKRADMGCVRSDFVTSDGLFQARSGLVHITTLDAIGNEQYVFQTVAPSSAVAYKRTPSKLTDAQIEMARKAGIAVKSITFEPARTSSYFRNDQTEQMTFLRQTIYDYQRALDQIALAVTMYPGVLASQAIGKNFWLGMRALTVDLEVMAENPPTGLLADIKGSFGAALEASEAATVELANKAGSAAAWVGNAAGKVAGAAASGFLDSANLATLVVAGIVGYVALQRWL